MIQQAINQAKKVRENAYAPYSNFKVGASVIMKSGNIYTGCNIENSSFSLTCCAERVAIFNAIANDETDFDCLVVTANTEEPVSPCGACRQVMSEFFNEQTEIYLMNSSDSIKKVNIEQLLPSSFRLNE